MKDTTIDIKTEIFSRYGFVRRVYDYHLYTAKGVRLLDLCQEGGSAILGWRSGKSKLAFKNTLDRGIIGTFPTETEADLVRAVQEILPHYPEVRWYATKEKARLACAAYLGLWSDIPLIESSLLHPEASVDIGPPGDSPHSASRALHGIPLWRPWLDDAFYSMSDRVDSSFLRSANDTLETMVLVSPLPFAGGCTLAVFATDGSEKEHQSILASDSIAPALLASLSRSFSDLSSVLCKRTEFDWCRFDSFITPFWDRRGPYLVPLMRRSRYPAFFSACLDAGILISPDYDTPSVIPFSADAGEFKIFSSLMGMM